MADDGTESLEAQLRRVTAVELREGAPRIADVRAVPPDAIAAALRVITPAQFAAVAGALKQDHGHLGVLMRQFSHEQLLAALPQTAARQPFCDCTDAALRLADDNSAAARAVTQNIGEHVRLKVHHKHQQLAHAAGRTAKPVRPAQRPTSPASPPAAYPRARDPVVVQSQPADPPPPPPPPPSAPDPRRQVTRSVKPAAAVAAPAPAPPPRPVTGPAKLQHSPSGFRPGDTVRVCCPQDLFQPRVELGTVLGHSRGRVGVVLDSGARVGVVPSDVAPVGGGSAQWIAAFPIGTAVEIVDPPTGGSRLNGKSGFVTGTARGRVGVLIDGVQHGLAEQSLRPALGDEGDSDGGEDCGGALLDRYPRGSRVRIRDPDGQFCGGQSLHDKPGVVVGCGRGRVGVLLDSGKIVGFGPAQVQRVYGDEDDEEPNLSARWKAGMRVTVSEPPVGGVYHGRSGVVTGHGDGRVSVQLDGGSAVLGVVPQRLRRGGADDDEGEHWATVVFPVGSRVSVRQAGVAELNDRQGIVRSVHEAKRTAVVAMQSEDGSQSGGEHTIAFELLARVVR
eukprot:TRINITY_DN2271_c0_g1_i1.p1 TRINITY_DN2271_c0_g1~~TRINITY_DN2271_c0_g1_i1.p1  ORF type:complete len:562 (+),score=161.98 TRINITY_DN2271_c0_g1_i1:63-1748(+)